MIVMVGIGRSIDLAVVKKRCKISQPPVLDTCSDDDDGHERREEKLTGQAHLH